MLAFTKEAYLHAACNYVFPGMAGREMVRGKGHGEMGMGELGGGCEEREERGGGMGRQFFLKFTCATPGTPARVT